jgi:hypothetical protein
MSDPDDVTMRDGDGQVPTARFDGESWDGGRE